MDIKKEQELFEKWHFEEHYVGDADKSVLYEKFKSDSEYVSYEVQYAWKAWQAAKSSAVLEGFVLVPKEPTEEMLSKAIRKYLEVSDLSIITNRMFHLYELIINEAMIEAAQGEGHE